MTALAAPIVGDLSEIRRRWTRAFVAGELIGFLPPAVVGATLAAIGVHDVVLVLGLTVGTLTGRILERLLDECRQSGRNQP